MNSYSIYNFVCECILKIDKVIDRIYKCVSKDELCKCHYTVGVIINGTLVFLMERLYMEAQDGLKTIAPPLFLNIFFYFLLV